MYRSPRDIASWLRFYKKIIKVKFLKKKHRWIKNGHFSLFYTYLHKRLNRELGQIEQSPSTWRPAIHRHRSVQQKQNDRHDEDEEVFDLLFFSIHRLLRLLIRLYPSQFKQKLDTKKFNKMKNLVSNNKKECSPVDEMILVVVMLLMLFSRFDVVFNFLPPLWPDFRLTNIISLGEDPE